MLISFFPGEKELYNLGPSGIIRCFQLFCTPYGALKSFRKLRTLYIKVSLYRDSRNTNSNMFHRIFVDLLAKNVLKWS